MVFGVFDPLFLARKSSITWGEEHKGVFGLSGSHLELRCLTPPSHRSGKKALSNLLYPRPWALPCALTGRIGFLPVGTLFQK